MTYTAEMISPELAGMLQKVNRADMLGGFTVQDSDLEWYRAEAARDHPEKSEAEREAWTVYCSLFDPTAAHNVKEPGTAVSPTDAATAMQRMVAGLFASQERRETVRAEQAQKSADAVASSLVAVIMNSSASIVSASNRQELRLCSIENTIDEHRQATTAALNDATDRLERVALQSASATASQLALARLTDAGFRRHHT